MDHNDVCYSKGGLGIILENQLNDSNYLGSVGCFRFCLIREMHQIDFTFMKDHGLHNRQVYG